MANEPRAQDVSDRSGGRSSPDIVDMNNPPPTQVAKDTTPLRQTSMSKRRSTTRSRSPRLRPYQTDGPLQPKSTASPYNSGNSAFSVLSPDATDRVFPIRSVVSVDPDSTPASSGEGVSGNTGTAEGRATSASINSMHYRTSSGPSIPAGQSGRDTARTRISRSDEPRDTVGGKHQQKSSETSSDDESQVRSQVTRNVESVHSYSPSSTSAQASVPTSESGDQHGVPPRDQELGGGMVTTRFKHVTLPDGHAVITGREGDHIQRCEDEPIHIPGAIQGFGLLIALRPEEQGKLSVRIVSENSRKIIGYSPKALFDLESFTDILSEEQAENLLDHVDFIRDDDADPATNGPEVFTISVRPPQKRSLKLWCAMHINDSNPDLIICEFELDDDQLFPLVPVGEGTPDLPEDTLDSRPTPEELAESTINNSKPLRVLRGARKRKGEAAAMEVFNIMSQVQEQLASAPNLDTFLKVLVGVVKELSGFHRVMIYQFDQNWNGRVVTELVDPRATKDLYKGLNFPASDIPKQARDLYKINKVRLLYDRDQETARLVCRALEDLEVPLDLTYAYLRAISPIHIKYLANMAVRASMSISINAFGELWGLIACHSYGAKGMRVSFPIRKMCRVVGDSASRNIERLSYASRLQARKLINTVPTGENASGYIIASSDDLLSLFDADFGMLSIRDETKILGQLEQSHEALALLTYLRMRKIGSIMSSQDLRQDFPDLRYSPGFKVIAGLLLVPLTISGDDFIVFFRKGQLKEVKWAGNPHEKHVKEGTESYLEPRKSFKTWSETVEGKCREWDEQQIETAAVLCLVYGKFIEVWRQKEAAIQSSQLTRLLLANSAHEVRTPLNAIINYLEIAMEGSLDTETRENLSKSHSASKSLIYVINDLLDLTRTEEGHDLIKDDLFDLPATIREATDMFLGDAKRKGIEFEVAEDPNFPGMVMGDQRRVRQAVSNLTANAIQHTSSGAVRVELSATHVEQDRVDVDIVVQDTGIGMSTKKLDALFGALEQVQTETGDVLEELGDDQEDLKQIESGDESKRTLGLGLAVVARIIRNMNGQLRLKSEEGKGSRFVIQLPFYLQNGHEERGEASGNLSSAPALPQTPPVDDGEVMLVKANAHSTHSNSSEATATGLLPEKTTLRKKSTESIASLITMHSGSSIRSGRSDVDRLIDAISEPHPMSESSPKNRLDRSGSRSSRRSVPGFGAKSTSKAVERPVGPSRAHSYTPSGHLVAPVEEMTEYSQHGKPGQVEITDSGTPMKAVRVPDELQYEQIEHVTAAAPSLFIENNMQRVIEEGRGPQDAGHLQVLVAEDDPINSKIMKKRLEKAGHDVHLTVNGEECATLYSDKAAFFDVVLMDMQMPIVDGLTSTKMIRSHEKADPFCSLSCRASLNGRVPVFAVSASLLEREREKYISAGFDGWILKPVDFKRLNTILQGIVDDSTRQNCLYKPGEWEKGGWFEERRSRKSSAELSDASPTGQKMSPTQGK